MERKSIHTATCAVNGTNKKINIIYTINKFYSSINSEPSESSSVGFLAYDRVWVATATEGLARRQRRFGIWEQLSPYFHYSNAIVHVNAQSLYVIEEVGGARGVEVGGAWGELGQARRGCDAASSGAASALYSTEGRLGYGHWSVGGAWPGDSLRGVSIRSEILLYKQ